MLENLSFHCSSAPQPLPHTWASLTSSQLCMGPQIPPSCQSMFPVQLFALLLSEGVITNCWRVGGEAHFILRSGCLGLSPFPSIFPSSYHLTDALHPLCGVHLCFFFILTSFPLRSGTSLSPSFRAVCLFPVAQVTPTEAGDSLLLCLFPLASFCV